MATKAAKSITINATKYELANTLAVNDGKVQLKAKDVLLDEAELPAGSKYAIFDFGYEAAGFVDCIDQDGNNLTAATDIVSLLNDGGVLYFKYSGRENGVYKDYLETMSAVTHYNADANVDVYFDLMTPDKKRKLILNGSFSVNTPTWTFEKQTDSYVRFIADGTQRENGVIPATAITIEKSADITNMTWAQFVEKVRTGTKVSLKIITGHNSAAGFDKAYIVDNPVIIDGIVNFDENCVKFQFAGVNRADGYGMGLIYTGAKPFYYDYFWRVPRASVIDWDNFGADEQRRITIDESAIADLT